MGCYKYPSKFQVKLALDTSKNAPILSVLVPLTKLLTPMLNMETLLQALTKEPRNATNLLPFCLTRKRIALGAPLVVCQNRGCRSRTHIAGELEILSSTIFPCRQAWVEKQITVTFFRGSALQCQSRSEFGRCREIIKWTRELLSSCRIFVLGDLHNTRTNAQLSCL